MKRIEDRNTQDSSLEPIKGSLASIQENLERLSSLYMEDRHKIEQNLELSMNHARTMELVKQGSANLSGNDVHSFRQAIETKQLYENEV